MSPLPANNADNTLHAIGSVSLAPVFTPQGRPILNPAVEAPMLEAATARRLPEAFMRGAGHGLLQLGAPVDVETPADEVLASLADAAPPVGAPST